MLPKKYIEMPKEEVFERINVAKKALGERLYILAHHYQRDEVYRFGDATGDSLKLSKLARENAAAEFIVFCGVHFMAETADILNFGKKIVTLPDITAGCPMADSAQKWQVEKAWTYLQDMIGDTIVPVTYVNSYATLKAFCGRHDGFVCTSTNAERVLEEALKLKERVFFFPDQHLGRNVAIKMGIPLEEIILYDKTVSQEQLEKAKIILWSGCCPVHDRFRVEDVNKLKAEDPDLKLLVHPEVPYEVAQMADYMGSTEYIINTLADADPGSSWVVATEIHLVGRLIKQHQDKKIQLLGEPICMCSMMDRTSPEHLCWNLEELVKGNVVNRIQVDADVRKEALLALERMVSL